MIKYAGVPHSGGRWCLILGRKLLHGIQISKGFSSPKRLASADLTFKQKVITFCFIYNPAGSRVTEIPLLNQKTKSPDGC